MKKPISIILIFCHLLLILPNLFAASAQQEMNIRTHVGEYIVGDKGKNDGIIMDSYYELVRQTPDGEIVMGIGQVKVVEAHKCGLKIIEMGPDYQLSASDKLKKLESDADLLMELQSMNSKQTKPFTTNVNGVILNPDQEQKYNNQKISVKLIGVNTSKYSYNKNPARYDKSKRWRAYKGAYRLTEQEFYEITGYTTKAQKAQKYKDGNTAMLIIGPVLMGGGFLLALRHNKEKNNGMDVMGYALGGLGAGITLIGGVSALKNWSAFAKVDGIANEYNRTLKLEIVKKW